MNRRAALLLSILMIVSSIGLNTASSGNNGVVTSSIPPGPITADVSIDGDWNVSTYVIYANSSIHLTGNLTVESTGRLELINTTLTMNLSRNGQFRILVDGTLSLADLDMNPATQGDACVITSGNSLYKYVIQTRAGSLLIASNSRILYAGYDTLNSGLLVSGAALIDGMSFQNVYFGINIRNSAVTVANTVFTGGYYGVYAYFCNPTLMNVTVTGSTSRGMYLYYSTPVMENCLLLNNKIGIYFQNSEPTVTSCNISGSDTAGIYTWYSSPLLTNCVLANTWDIDVRSNSFPRLLNTQFDESKVKLERGLYVSVGRRITATVVDAAKTPQPDIMVTVLDSQGNPAASDTTDAMGTCSLAFRQRFITKEGLIEMDEHTVMAFALRGSDVVYGELITTQFKGNACTVTVDNNPSGIQIWPADYTMAGNRQFHDTSIIALGNVNVNSGSLELDNCDLMVYSSTTRTITFTSSTLLLTDSWVRSIGTSRILEPARTKINTDSASPVYATDSGTRWTTEFVIQNSASVISNFEVQHASSSGLKTVSCSPVIDGFFADWSPVGIQMSGGSPTLSQISVERARTYGIYASQSSAMLADVHVNNSARGIYAYYGMLAMVYVDIDNSDYGIYGVFTFMDLASFSIDNSINSGIHIIDSSVNAFTGTVAGSGTALHVQTSSFCGESLTLGVNNIGIKSVGSAPVLLNSSLDNPMNINVDRGSSASIVNCTLDPAKRSVQPSGHIDIGHWFHVRVLDTLDQPVPGCDVSVRDSDDIVSGSGMTDELGMLRNLAFRQTRYLWNDTITHNTHTILAFRNLDGLQGSAFTPLIPEEFVNITTSFGGMGLVEWTTSTNIFSCINYSDATIIAHGGVTIETGACLGLYNSTLWSFGSPFYFTTIDVKAGASFNMLASRLMPLRAMAPLQPSDAQVIYRAKSRGEIADSLIQSIYQVSTYTSYLAIDNTSFREMGGTGLYAKACSPTVNNSIFNRCSDGIYVETGSPTLAGVSMIECKTNGLYANAGAPIIKDTFSIKNNYGFYLTNGADGQLSDCRAENNYYGYYMNLASPEVFGSSAINNTNAGFYCQNSHPRMDSITAIGSSYGGYFYKSWAVISNSTFSKNSNGIYGQQSAPYLDSCVVDGNGLGLNLVEEATGILADVFASGKARESATFVNGDVRDHISVSLPSRAIVREANLSITGSEIGADAIIEDSNSQFYPAIYKNWIVWQDYRNDDWDIYAYDLSMDSDGNDVPNYLETPPLADDPALVRITNNPYMQSNPDIYEDTIVWTDYRNGSPDIYAYSFFNSTEWVVCGEAGTQAKPAIDGNRIVWEDYRSGNYDIYMFNISTGETVRLSTSTNHDMGARIHNDYVVWYSFYGSPPSNDYSDVILFDIKNWTLTNINSDTPIQYNPDIYDDTVVWHDNRNGNWEIYSYSMETKIISRLTYDPDNEQNFMPRIFEDDVVYYFHNRITDQWSVRMSNLTTGEMTTLENEVDGDSHPVIYGQRVAWVNRTGNKNDIYVLDFSLPGYVSDMSLDINNDGTTEFEESGSFNTTQNINGSWLVEVFNKNLGLIDGGDTAIPMSIAANGTGRVTLGPISLKYDIPTYIVNCTLSNSTNSGAWCTGSKPVFVNSSFENNSLDFYMNSESRARALNTTFSNSKLYFQDKLSNLTVQNFLHVRVQNITSDPLNATVQVTDNGAMVHEGYSGAIGNIMWMPVTDRTHNYTGIHENITVITVTLGTNIFADNPRDVDMSASHWEIFSTDSVGPEARDPYPLPDWTISETLPEISVRILDNQAVDISSVQLFVQGISVSYGYAAITGGYNISYIPSEDFLNGTVVTCRIIASDFDNNTLDYSWEFLIDIQAIVFSIQLQEGWNLFSLPFDAHDMSIDSVLLPIWGKFRVIKTYSRADPSKNWLVYRPGRAAGTNDFTSLDRSVGYWIYMTEPCVLTVSGVPAESTSITLYAGWNLVGYPSLANVAVSDALGSTGMDRVEGFDPISPYIIELAPTYLMMPSEAFWVRVPADTVWVVDW